MRFNLNLSEDLVKRVDEKAKQLYMSRSAYISMCLAERLQFDDMLGYMPEFFSLIRDTKDMSDKEQDCEK